EGAGLRELRRAERAGVEAIAATDAQVLVVQNHALVGAVETVDRAHRHARGVRAVHAGDRDRLLGADDAVVDGDHAAAVHAPGNLVLVLAGGHAAVALDAALGVAEEFHSGHGCLLFLFSLCPLDLADGGFGFLHHRHRIVAVGRGGVDRLATHDRRRAVGIVGQHVLALPPAREVEWDEGMIRTHAFGHQRLDLEPGAGGRLHPDVLPVPDASVVRRPRIDLDEVVLHQPG